MFKYLAQPLKEVSLKKEDVVISEIPPRKADEGHKFCRPSSKSGDPEILSGLKTRLDLKKTKEIKHIEFTMLSPTDIRKMGVCPVKETRFEGLYSVYDKRMGPFSDSETGAGKIIKSKCETCGKHMDTMNPDEDCNGHFGYIELEYPIPHPIQTNLVKKYLQLICKFCHRLIYDKEYIWERRYNRLAGMRRLDKLYKESENLPFCSHCEKPIGRYKEKDGLYHIEYKKPEKYTLHVEYNEIKDIFNDLTDEDFRLMGFEYDKMNIKRDNVDRLHPRNLIIEVLPVLPICARIPINNGGELSHDDFTIKYVDIIKHNNKIKESNNDLIRMYQVNHLYTNIKCLMDNSKGKCKDNNNRAFKSIKQRLNGKQGQIRHNLQGKRCDFTARTVITPEAQCKADELIVPEEIAKELTYPMNVNKLNMEECKQLIRDGLVKTIIFKDGKCRYLDIMKKKTNITLHPEDIIDRDGKQFSVESYEWKNKKPLELKRTDKVYREGKQLQVYFFPEDRYKKIENELEEGFVIERHLRDGDIVILNRQPTLWKGSMRAKRVKVRPGKTFRFALSSTEAFNADFDGDKNALNCPQQATAQ